MWVTKTEIHTARVGKLWVFNSQKSQPAGNDKMVKMYAIKIFVGAKVFPSMAHCYSH